MMSWILFLIVGMMCTFTGTSAAHHQFHFVTNSTLAGTDIGCKHTTNYVATAVVRYDLIYNL